MADVQRRALNVRRQRGGASLVVIGEWILRTGRLDLIDAVDAPQDPPATAIAVAVLGRELARDREQLFGLDAVLDILVLRVVVRLPNLHATAHRRALWVLDSDGLGHEVGGMRQADVRREIAARHRCVTRRWVGR